MDRCFSSARIALFNFTSYLPVNKDGPRLVNTKSEKQYGISTSPKLVRQSINIIYHVKAKIKALFSWGWIRSDH